MKKMSGKRILLLALSLMLMASLMFTGCSSTPAESPNTEENESADAGEKTPNYPTRAMEFIAPSGAGGGWDLTIRTVAKTLQDTGLVSVPMPVTNREGGGGGVNLAYMQERKDSDTIISVYSPPLILINLNGSSQYGYKDTTPLAGLITDYGAFMVGKNSRFSSLNDVMEELKKDPKSVKVGGASAVGSMDHIQFLIMAKAAGVERLSEIDYISFQDGSAPAQIMGGHIDLYSAGLSQIRGLIESGDLIVLAQTADKRIGTGVIAEIPTAKELGIDATFENWRGLFGTPNMPDYAVAYWEDVLTKMVETSEWKKACETNGWDEAYKNKEDFQKFLNQVNEDYKEILQEIGILK